ncbi:hypothetical protein [Nonomuraea indica]|uniref:Uncharacterized protein n=1 Tax=Nonomuraea indica TaxID=1581193 RepID=A0ABW7ZX50_9ACTN
MPVRRPRAIALVARRVPATVPTTDTITGRASRMARFAAGARRVVVRASLVGGLVAAGWLLAVLFGASFAAPASAAAVTGPAPAAPSAADSTAATGAGAPQTVTGPLEGGFPTADGTASAPDDAEAMAGLTVDGLTSQSDPGLPAPSTASSMLDTDGLVPNGGGSGPFGPCMGDIARSVYDPRIEARRAHLACVLPPVVRTAADDPSFSPD